MVAAAAVETAIRFAPADPELPTPWKALVDGSTGYIYYWNPESNVTQYEKPIPARPPPRVAPLPSVINVQSHHQSHHQQPAQHQQAQPQAQAQPRWDSRSGGNGTSNRFSALQPQQQQQQQATVTVNSTVVERREVVREAAPASMSVEAYRKQHEVTATGDNVPPPFMAFDQTGFPPELLRELQDAGFRAPTPIQAQSWPVALQSRDIVAIAKTGSGKTLGYLLPAFILLKRRRNDNRMGPTVLVLAPTRELATQIQAEAIKFGRSSRISCTCLYGGAQKGPQIKELERGVDIVVATPGRLNDILEMGKIEMSQISYLILDEADRMLDMGFEPQIRKIVNELPRTRQTLMYTATWPNVVKRIAADLLVNPVQVTIGILDELATNKAITQHIELVPSFEKERRVEAILRGQQPGSKIIIFCSTKRMCDQLARSLGRQYGAMAIHGDKSQIERDSVLNQFRSGRSPILVATDVAARGLDIKDIKVVINYDFPNGIEDYVHRIGRTGRAGATGVAHTFITDQDSKHSTELIKILERAEQKIPQELRDLASRPGYFMKGRGGRGDYGGGRGRGGSSWGSSGGGRFDRSERGNGGSFGRNAAPYDSKNDYAETWNTDYSYNGKRSRSRSPDKYPYKRTSPRRSGLHYADPWSIFYSTKSCATKTINFVTLIFNVLNPSSSSYTMLWKYSNEHPAFCPLGNIRERRW